MSLSLYRQKRNFRRTPEPQGAKAAAVDALQFVVQRHHASHLHYDFRLELGGALKSWAVPKGPSLNPADRRLAMQVEDHPLGYATFEGQIPEGNYGAGRVDIWDSGTWQPVDERGKAISPRDALKAWEAGSLKAVLKGRKLKGGFAVVKMKGSADNAWLLLKHKDRFATEQPYDSEALAPKAAIEYTRSKRAGKPGGRHPLAVAKKATVSSKSASPKSASPKSISAKAASANTASTKTATPASALKPMLASPHDVPFDDPAWLFELKWDGYRAIADCKGEQVKLVSRSGLSFATQFPQVHSALMAMELDATLDGEIVALDEHGHPSFQALQHYDPTTHTLCFYVFDCLRYKEHGIIDEPLEERKEVLREILPLSDVVRYCDHVKGRGREFFTLVRERGLEGLMAKRADSPYRPGQRSKEWLKIRNILTDEAVIVGFTQARGSRKHFGALVLAERDGKAWRYLGHTGTGFDDKTLGSLHQKLLALQTPDSPFAGPVRINAPVTWVKPKLVAAVKYTERTRDGALRHPVFMGLRTDKKASDIVAPAIDMTKTAPAKAKSAAASKKAAPTAAPAKKAALTTKDDTHVVPPKSARSSTRPAQANRAQKPTTAASKKEPRGVPPITNPDKIFWPAEGYTKGDVIAFYEAIHPYILRYLKDRPLSLLRNPNGILDKGFFQKDAGKESPAFVDTVPIWSESSKRTIDYVMCNNRASLRYLANLGCIEINPWHSRVGSLDRPDYLLLDFDPSEKNTFAQVVETAMAAREVLEEAGVEGFCKTSGSTGLHICVPTRARYTYAQVRAFAELLCHRIHDMLPGFTSLERSLAKRGPKLYLDYGQNGEGQTVASAYSLRPKPGATCSAPLLWKEVRPGLSMDFFNIRTMPARLGKVGDVWAGVLGKGMDMGKALKRLGG